MSTDKPILAVVCRLGGLEALESLGTLMTIIGPHQALIVMQPCLAPYHGSVMFLTLP